MSEESLRAADLAGRGEELLEKELPGTLLWHPNGDSFFIFADEAIPHHITIGPLHRQALDFVNQVHAKMLAPRAGGLMGAR